MKRRDFLKVASGAAGGAAAVGTATASSGSSLSLQEGNETSGGNETGSGSGGGSSGGGGTKTVEVGPNGDFVYTPGTSEPLYVSPGTTVEFVWKSNNHNIVVSSQPEGASWPGHEAIENSGFTYSYTFETKGTYEYFCQPHKDLGMTATIIVNESGSAPAPEGPVELSPHEMGVPFQAHFVGIATILAMFVSLVYTFFVLKYGESRHASAPNKK